jgi:hypothetical protein
MPLLISKWIRTALVFPCNHGFMHHILTSITVSRFSRAKEGFVEKARGGWARRCAQKERRAHAGIGQHCPLLSSHDSYLFFLAVVQTVMDWQIFVDTCLLRLYVYFRKPSSVQFVHLRYAEACNRYKGVSKLIKNGYQTCKTWYSNLGRKHLFLDISFTNNDTVVPSLYQFVETRRIEAFWLLSQPLRTSVSNSSSSVKRLPHFSAQLWTVLRNKHFPP